MKKLKVTWQDGSWNHRENQAVATALVHPQARISVLGGNLVFQDPAATETVLVLPEERLISAVLVEAEEPSNG